MVESWITIYLVEALDARIVDFYQKPYTGDLRSPLKELLTIFFHKDSRPIYKVYNST